MQHTEIVIIGAGIVGSTMSYLLQQQHIPHLVIDQRPTLLDNASGAAGAFIKPKIGKPTARKQYFDEAFKYAYHFYRQFDIEIAYGSVELVEQYNSTYEHSNIFVEPIELFGHKGYYFKEAMRIAPDVLLTKLINPKEAKLNDEVKTLKYQDSRWVINGEITAQKVILTTGYKLSHHLFLQEPYLYLEHVYGQTIIVKSQTPIPISWHKQIYCSNSDSNNHIFIGATHQRLKNTPIIAPQDGTDYLLNTINSIVALKQPTIIDKKEGIRACSNDFLPIVGQVIQAKSSLRQYPALIHGLKIEAHRLIYYPYLYICNGMGGRGYTFAPQMCHYLVEHIVNNAPIPHIFTLYPRFMRYCKKELSGTI